MIILICSVLLQLEAHFYLQQEPMRRFLNRLGIVFVSYLPIDTLSNANNEKSLKPINTLPFVQKLCKKYGKSPYQLQMKYNIQRGMIVVVDSVKLRELIKEVEVWDFTIDSQDMSKLRSFELGERGRTAYFLEINNELYKHPEYPFSMIGWQRFWF